MNSIVDKICKIELCNETKGQRCNFNADVEVSGSKVASYAKLFDIESHYAVGVLFV